MLRPRRSGRATRRKCSTFLCCTLIQVRRDEMNNWRSVGIGCAATALALMVAGSVMASGVLHENKLTFSRPVALPGIVLPPGKYSFDVVDSALDVVVVRDADRTQTFYMGFTVPLSRPKGMSPNAMVTLGEARAHEAPPITAWYEIGTATGHGFRY